MSGEGEENADSDGGLSSSRILSDPQDHLFLSPSYCLLRAQLEVFWVTSDDVKGRSAPPKDAAASGRKRAVIEVGSVGIRCAHCSAARRHRSVPLSLGGKEPAGDGAPSAVASASSTAYKGSVSYPKSIRLVYQSIRNWQRHHFPTCPHMPPDVRAKSIELRTSGKKKNSTADSVTYWQRCLVRMGCVDTERGIRLRNGRFEDPSPANVEVATLEQQQQPRHIDMTSTMTAPVPISFSSLSMPAVGITRDFSTGSANSYQSLGVDANIYAGIERGNRDASLLTHVLSSAGAAPVAEGVVEERTGIFAAGGCDNASLQAELARSAQHMGLSLRPEETAFCGGDIDSRPQWHHQSSRPTESMPSGPLAVPGDRATDPTRPMASEVNKAAAQASSCTLEGLLHLSIGTDTTTATTTEILTSSPLDNLLELGESETASATTRKTLGRETLLEPTRCKALTGEVLNGRVTGTDITSSGPVLSYQNVDATAGVSKRAVLDRVNLAHDIVQAVGEIRRFSPFSSPAQKDNKDACYDSLQRRRRSGGHPNDLVSLGAELYQLFAGRLPFDNDGERGPSDDDHRDTSPSPSSEESEKETDDSPPDERQHHHRKRRGKRTGRRRRRRYAPLSEVPGLPANLSDLVSDLLDAGTDGDDGCGAYGSVEEVRDDLRLMLSRPDRFLFGLDDSYSSSSHHGAGTAQLKFSVDALYGRADETSKLLEAYRRLVFPVDGTLSGGSSIVLVSGYSGTGKSALVSRAQARFAEMGARCVSGKFDIMQQVKPLSAVSAALDEYCLMLARDAAAVTVGDQSLRKVVSDALGEEGSALADFLPNLREVLLPLPSSRHDSGSPFFPSSHRTLMSPEAQQHRLSRLIRRLLISTCSRARPVVLFLDDLQWADVSSLEVIETLVTDAHIEGLLLVACYRDNEVGPDHPLTARLESIRRSLGDAAIATVHVSNLDRESVNTLLSDLLHLLPRKTRPLADLVMQKTGGNALFVVQFLTSLRNEGLLRFSLTGRRWEWDADKIRSHEVPDTVVEFVRAKLLRLAPDVAEALRVAAAFGTQCHEDVLRIVDKDPDRLIDTISALDVALSEGLMAKVEGPTYQFSHDQIQSAAYFLIPESDREAFHLRIGRSLWQHLSNDDMESYLFVMVDQLHRGAGLMTDSDEKSNLAQLSLLAGEKALAMSAFLPALAYMAAGMGLLVDDDWERNRSLCFNLYNSCAETEYILGQFEEMKGRLNQIFERAKSLQEKLRAYSTLVQSLIAQGQAMNAIDTALLVLRHLGEHFPSASSDMLVKQELVATQIILSNRTQDELLSLEVMNDEGKRETMKFLNLIISPTYTEKRALFPLLICRMVRISLSHGICNESAIGFASYGVILSGLLRDLDGGYRFGKLALATLDKFQSKDIYARVLCSVYGFINNWKEPIQASMAPLKDAIEVGLAVGDTEYAMLSAHLYTGTALCSGYPLALLYEEMKSYSKQMVKYKQHYIWSHNKPLRQATLNLLGQSADPVKLIGEEMDENNLLDDPGNAENQAVPIPVLLFYRMWLEYLFGNYEDAATTAKKNKSIVIHIVGRFAIVCNHVFFDGLIALALARKEGAAQYTDKIKETMDQMKKWASSTPWNCQHKLELMKAEHAYLVGDFDGAISAFDSAVEIASKNRFVHEEALALERTGLFYLETGDHSAATRFFIKARSCYEQWGASSKASHIQNQYL